MKIRRERTCGDCSRYDSDNKWCPVYANIREPWMKAHKCRCFAEKLECYDTEGKNGELKEK